MNRLIKSLATPLMITSVAAGLVACGNQAINKSVTTATGTSTGTGTTGTGIGTGTGVTSNGGVTCGSDNFCVNVVPPTDTTMILHQDGSYTTPCIVTAGSDTACILDADELDLYDQGLNMTYNVPPGMCAYFQMQPYFYYQYQPGKGPTAVQLIVNSTTGAVSETDSGDGYPNAALVAAAGAANVSQVGVRQPATNPPTCTADYTLIGGPNCCYGTYNLTVITNGIAAVSSPSWGGNPNNCLVGPAMDSQILFQGLPGNVENGYPIATLKALDGTPVSGAYAVKSPYAKNFSTNAYISNFWQSGTTGSYPMSGAPNAMLGPGLPTNVDVTGCGAGTFCSGNPWYEFDCLDAAEDVTARIRVMVRSWSSNINFAQFVATQNSTPANGSYNLYGPEPFPFGDQPILDRETWVTPANSSGVYAPTALGTGPGAVNSPCYNTGTANQSCGFGSMYPGAGN
jgi:hypothetical protein